MSDEQVNQGGTGQVVTGGAQANKSGKPTKKIIIIGSITVLILVVGGSLVLLHRNTTSKATNTETSTPVLAMDAKELSNAQATVSSDAKNKASPEVQALHYLQLGDAQYNVNNYKEAVAAYEKSLTFKGGDTNQTKALQGLVYAYERAGRHQDAIKTAQRVVEYYEAQPKSNLTAQAKLSTYSGIVTALQQGKSI